MENNAKVPIETGKMPTVKKNYLMLLLCALLLIPLFQLTARAQASSQVNISSQGSITYSPPTVNLAVIPDNWQLTYGSGPQIIFLDYDVVRTPGNPSIRLEPHTSNDVNSARECDGTWYAVQPGDHIVAKCWMRVLTNSSTPGYPYCGARIGIDFYGYVDGVYSMLPASDFWYSYYNGEYAYGYVQDSYGGTWQQRTLDIIVPATAKDSSGRDGAVTQIVLWMQGAPWVETPGATPVWFADAELYITSP